MAVLTLWLVNSQDVAPSDLSDLLVELEEIDPNANLLQLLRGGEAKLQLHEADDSELEVEDRELDDFELLEVLAALASGSRGLYDGGWDATRAPALLKANAEALAHFSAAVAAPRAQVDTLDFNAELSWLSDVVEVAPLNLVRAEQLRRAGRHAEALAQAWQHADMGTTLCEGTGGLILHAIGRLQQQQALAVARYILADPACPPAVCDDAAARCAALPAGRTGLAHQFRCEFTMFTLLSSSIIEADYSRRDRWPAPPAGETPARSSFLYHPHRTQALLAADYRRAIAELNLPYWQLPAPRTQPQRASGWQQALRLIGGNAAGTVLRETLASTLEYVARDAIDLDADRACTEAFARVVAAHRRTGARPGSLAKLFGGTAPIDPFDGAPLRYDPTRGLIWSVGPDGRDDGGTLTPEDQDPDDAALAVSQAWVDDAPDAGVRLPPK